MSRASSSRRPGSRRIQTSLTLAERIPLDEGELVLARRVVPDGPTRSYMQGRSVSAGELRLVGTRLLKFFGQHEHRKLMLASAQLEILDAFCGAAHLQEQARVRGAASRGPRELERELEELRDAGRRARARPGLPRVRDRGDRGRRAQRRRGGRARARAHASRRGGVAAHGRRYGGRGRSTRRDDDGGALARMAVRRGRARPRGRRRRRARRAGGAIRIADLRAAGRGGRAARATSTRSRPTRSASLRWRSASTSSAA